MRNSRAFTMIELVMVLVVVGILSVSVTAAIANAINRIRLENALDKITSDIRYAQYMATNTAIWYGVSFEVNPINRYTVYTTTGTADTGVADPGKANANLVVLLSTTYGTTLSSVTVEGGGTHIEFSPSGSPYSDKTGAVLTAESVVTLSNGVSTKTVRVTPGTGRVYQQ